MLYATILHVLAGGVTGSVFKARTLLLLLVFVLLEPVILILVQGSIAWPWALANIAGVQVGYLGGIYVRAVLEHAGYLLPGTRTRRAP